MYKLGKVVTSVGKKEERNITFATIIYANAFRIKLIPWLKNQVNNSETNYQKIDMWNIDNYQSIYANFFICETQVHSCTGSAIFGIPQPTF